MDPLRFCSTFRLLAFVVHIIFRVYIHSLSLYASIIDIILCQQLYSFPSRTPPTDTPNTGSQVAFAFALKYILFFTLSYFFYSFINIGADGPHYPH